MRGIIVFIFLAIVSIGPYPDLARGDELKIIPSVALKQEYTEYVEDSITTVSPGLRITERTERLNMALSARTDQLSYRKNKAYDTRNHEYAGDITYQVNERMSVSSNAGYTKDSRRDRDIDESGLVLGTAERERHRFAFSGNYLLSEITGADLSFNHYQDAFDDPEFTDSRSESVNLRVIHDMSYFIPLMTARANLGYSRYDFTGLNVENYSGTIGGAWEMTETLSLLTDFGGRYTFYEAETDVPTDPEDDFEAWGTTWQIILAYNGERTNGRLTLSQDIKAASGTAGTTERTTAGFDINQRFTEEFRGNLSIRYYLNQTDQEERDGTKTHTLSIHPRIRYDFTRDISVEASYRFTAISDREADTHVTRNSVFVRLVFQYPLDG